MNDNVTLSSSRVYYGYSNENLTTVSISLAAVPIISSVCKRKCLGIVSCGCRIIGFLIVVAVRTL